MYGDVGLNPRLKVRRNMNCGNFWLQSVRTLKNIQQCNKELDFHSTYVEGKNTFHFTFSNKYVFFQYMVLGYWLNTFGG